VNFYDPDGLISIREAINSIITAAAMWANSMTGDPGDVSKPVRTASSERAKTDAKRAEEDRKRGKKKQRGSAKCFILVPIWDADEDINSILDYDFDKSFDENMYQMHPDRFL